MLVRQTVGPVAQPVTLAEAKSHIVDAPDIDDDMIEAMIEAAARVVSGLSGRVLAAETWAVSLRAISSDGCRTFDLILPKSPVNELTEITWYDSEDQTQSADLTDFYLFADDDYARVRPKRGVNWPAANPHRDDAITVTFTAGYDGCPKNLKQAVLLLVAHLYENRAAGTERAMTDLPFGVLSLVDRDRVGWIQS